MSVEDRKELLRSLEPMEQFFFDRRGRQAMTDEEWERLSTFSKLRFKFTDWDPRGLPRRWEQLEEIHRREIE